MVPSPASSDVPITGILERGGRPTPSRPNMAFRASSSMRPALERCRLAARAPPSPACAEGASAIIVAAVISKTLRVLRKLRPSKFTEFDRESATGLVNIMLTVPALGERARFESLL